MALLTTIGLQAKQYSGYAAFDYLAVGTGTQTPSVNLTSLSSEVERVAIGAVTISGGVMILEAYFTPSQAVGTLTEWGIFDAASGGNLLAYGTFTTPVEKTSAEAMIITVVDEVKNA